MDSDYRLNDEITKHTIKLQKTNLTVDIEEDELGIITRLYNKKNGNIIHTAKVFYHEIKSLKRVKHAK